MNWTAWKAIRASLAIAALVVALPGMARGQANTCNGILTVDYVTGPNFAIPGDILRLRLTLGTGSITGGTQLTINRLRFDLDCNSNFALGLPCTDEGLMVEYQGDTTVTTTCGTVLTSGHVVAGAAPNEVVFSLAPAIVIPANQAIPPGFCNVEFDVKVLAVPSIDATPAFIEEVSGYRNIDAACDNGTLASGGQQSSSIPLCPVCNDNNACTSDACNQTTGQCVFTPVADSTPCADADGNACTFAGCEAGTCVQAHNQTICPPDSNACTNDPACNPTNGLCEKPPVADSTPCADIDGNACTFAGCEVGACVQAHNQTVCPPDSNACTNDPACNPANGLCEKPPVPDSSPCPDTDTNACTTAGCEAGNCVQTHNQIICNPDTNVCTLDPACNPANGLCEHPAAPDSTPCPDTDGNVCSLAGCDAGVCVQSHVSSCINHFTCYEVKPFSFTPVPNVSLVDTFGSTTVTVNRPSKLCAPADKNDEDPSAVTDPDHLTGYKIRNPAIKRVDQTIVNQFGSIRLDVVKTDLLFVPTAKALGGVAPPEPAFPAVDHFQCYKVKRTRGAPRFQKILGVKVDDQFGTGTFDLLKPRHLCAPVNKRNEAPGAELHPQFLLCYKVKARAPFTTQPVSLGNQFGPHTNLSLIRRQEFCVPSALNPPPTTTTTGAPPTTIPSTTTTTSTVTTTTVGSPSGAFVEASS